MKKLLVIIVLLVLGFFGYKYFMGGKNDGSGGGSQTGGGTHQRNGGGQTGGGGQTSGGTHHRNGGTRSETGGGTAYAATLETIQKAVFSPLDDGQTTDPMPQLRQVAERAKKSMQASDKNAEASRVAYQLSSYLAQASHERQSCIQGIKEIQSKDYGGLKGMEAQAARTKTFLTESKKKNWATYVARRQPICQRLLGQLQSMETGGATQNSASQSGGSSRTSGGTPREKGETFSYVAAFSSLQKGIFSPLDDGQTTDPIPQLRQLADRAKRSIQASDKNADASRLALRICSGLASVSQERQKYIQSIKEIQSKDYGGLKGMEEQAARTKTFMTEAKKKNWVAYVAQQKPIFDRLLGQLRAMENRR